MNTLKAKVLENNLLLKNVFELQKSKRLLLWYERSCDLLTRNGRDVKHVMFRMEYTNIAIFCMFM